MGNLYDNYEVNSSELLNRKVGMVLRYDARTLWFHQVRINCKIPKSTISVHILHASFLKYKYKNIFVISKIRYGVVVK